MKRTALGLSLALALTIGLSAGCADPSEVSDIKAKVEEMQAQQKDILAKLDGLTAGQKKIIQARAPAAARPSRPTEDPNKVYDVPVGSSYYKGAKDGSVTIVEFSDFQ